MGDVDCEKVGAVNAVVGIRSRCSRYEILIICESNNGISVGDTVFSARASWTVTGLGAFSDYSALFENNADSMFDSIRFGVGMVSAADFASFDENSLVPCYAWKYRTAPENESEEKELSDELMKKLADLLPLEDYVPRYQNQAIRFTGDGPIGTGGANASGAFLSVLVPQAGFEPAQPAAGRF